MYNGTVVNNSLTTTGVAGEEIKGGPFTAVMYKDGALVTATAGEMPMGILLAESDDIVNAGDEVTIQIAGGGCWEAGGEFEAGDPLASDDNGCAVKAAVGEFILAIALEESEGEGQAVSVQITKSGYMAAPVEEPEGDDTDNSGETA